MTTHDNTWIERDQKLLPDDNCTGPTKSIDCEGRMAEKLTAEKYSAETKVIAPFFCHQSFCPPE